MIARLLFFIVFIIQQVSIFAQYKHPISIAIKEVDEFQRFDNYTTKDGLPSNNIHRLFQDKDGFLWLATDNGLSRYEGYSFTNFQPAEGDSTSISSRHITSIAQDNDGFIWVGTENGLNRLNPVNGKFKRFFKENSAFLKDNHIRALLVCSDGYLWIDCANATLTQLNTKKLEPTFFSRPGKASTTYTNHTIYEAKNKEIWAGGIGIPTIIVNKTNSSLVIVKDTIIDDNNIFNPASDFYEDENGMLWVGNVNSRLSINNLSNNSHHQVTHYPCVYAICEDKNGYLWLGGYSKGVVRYCKKSNEATQYISNPNNPKSICGSHTFDILCDRSGTVWFATDQGLSKYSYYKYKFPIYWHIPETESPASNKITALFQDADNDLIIGTQDAGFSIFKTNDKNFEHFKYVKDDPSTVGSNYITAIDQENDGTIWFTHWNGNNCSLTRFDKRSKTLKRFKTIDNYNWYSDVLCTPDGDVIAGSWGTGVVYLDKQKGREYKVLPTNMAGFPTLNTEVKNIVCDKNSVLWMTTEYLNAYNSKSKTFSLYIPKKSKRPVDEVRVKTLPHKTVDARLGEYYLFTDKNGNLWLINSEAITQYNYETDNFVEYKIESKINPWSIANQKNTKGFWIGGTNSIYSFSIASKEIEKVLEISNLGDINLIEELDDNCLLVGSSNGLYRIVLSEKIDSIKSNIKISPILFKRSSVLTSGNILLTADQGIYLLNKQKELKKIEDISAYSILKLKDNDIYIGTNKGLLQYNENAGIVNRWKFDPYSNDQLQGSKIVSIAQTTDGAIWVLSDVCVSMLNADKKTFTNYLKPASSDITGWLITALFIDSKGYLWVGTSNGQGLNRVNQKKGHVDHFINFLWDTTSFRKCDIYGIFESKNGTIWVATSKGLSRFNEQAMNFTHFDKRNGLASDVIMSVNEDGNGNLWLGTTGGLSCFNPTNYIATNYTWKDGVQGGDFSKGATIKLSNGNLVFGGMEGYNIFCPDSIKQNPYKPEPIITRIKINGDIRFISNPKKLKLKYAERNIEILFSCNDYNFPENNHVRYKLEGFEDKFVLSGNNRSAMYTNLSPGNYQFMVEVCSNDGIWSHNPLVLGIKVGYPIWFQWWAVILEILLLVGILILIVRHRTRMVVNQKNLLEKEVAKRTEQILAKNEEIIVQRDILRKQKDHIHKIHNQLSDSIEYAQYLQSSFYLSRDQRDELLGENFLLYMPKDKVGGDFFWAHKRDNKIAFAVVDCTGHGVPGALMSMIGFSSMKDVSMSDNVLNPSKTLSILHHKVSSVFSGSPSETSMVTAMDIGYCVLDRANNKLKYAGGHIDILIAKWNGSKKSIIEIKGNNKRVGNKLQNDSFNETEIEISNGDLIYLFSDGISDQFNAAKNEKFSKRRVKELLNFISDYPLDVQQSLFVSGFYEWKGDNEQTDDITVLGIRV